MRYPRRMLREWGGGKTALNSARVLSLSPRQPNALAAAIYRTTCSLSTIFLVFTAPSTSLTFYKCSIITMVCCQFFVVVVAVVQLSIRQEVVQHLPSIWTTRCWSNESSTNPRAMKVQVECQHRQFLNCGLAVPQLCGSIGSPEHLRLSVLSHVGSHPIFLSIAVASTQNPNFLPEK